MPSPGLLQSPKERGRERTLARTPALARGVARVRASSDRVRQAVGRRLCRAARAADQRPTAGSGRREAEGRGEAGEHGRRSKREG